jgi:hypothetical protein|tara:strand:+ start:828 stop:2744 length:1917 start_codon:yes stop_codon:yes gene_type:complete
MSKSFTLNQLTEGIRDRHVGQESSRIQEKWTRTGLLRGLKSHHRETMSRLLENQAAQVLRESSTLGGGGNSPADSGTIDGFSNIAFPIVRRVFGGLVANELVSIQPMSLPSGLLFYLDYTYGSDVGGSTDESTLVDGAPLASTYSKGQSIYNNPAGKGVRTGSDATGGQYDLVGTSYSQVHETGVAVSGLMLASGSWGAAAGQSHTAGALMGRSGSDGKLIQFDPQVSTDMEAGGQYTGIVVDIDNAVWAGLDNTQVKSISLFARDGATYTGLTAPGASFQAGTNILNIRRLNQMGTYATGVFTPNPFVTPNDTTNAALFTLVKGAIGLGPTPDHFALGLTASFAKVDQTDSTVGGGDGSMLVIPSFESDFDATPEPVIPEIDIKIESIAVTATTRKLRARWSPELAQDLNAYHSMDAEVELTQILSEQIALEIDREILNDLLTQAKGANFYWDRRPGSFVNKRNGATQALASSLATGPSFTGTVREWYETLVETIIDVANEIHRKTLRGSANFIVVSPEVATIFEASVLYKPNLKIDGQGQVALGNIGAESIGSLSNRFTVYKDPYFPRNKILVGYKGGSYLESGYVYAPYVPLIVTPTIFAPEDFTPRKGVMTRYGKKMVRADFYGTVTCLGMDII